ncbi:hypothetical protein DEU56DRAFT_738558, partial [Suillus clintonianus]|uniref:uncharacterized protein n=1 Tax=Suillus clintonianus TaxID=1904413 RepID=UPI001B86A1A6
SATVSARSGRQIRMPARYTDYVPGTATHLAHMPPTSRQARGQPAAPSPPAPIPNSPNEERGTPPADVQEQPTLIPYQTAPDELGLFRIYAQRPTLIPHRDQSLDAIADAPTFETQGDPNLDRSHIVPGLPSQDIQPDDIFSGFSSPTAGLLFCWQYSGINSKEDARNYDDVREKRLLGDYLKDKSNPFRVENGWRSSSVKIRLPKEREKFPSEDEAPEMEIPGIYHRSITDIIASVFEDSVASTFHMTPFQQLWKVSEEHTVNVYGEAYSSPAFIEAYEEINALPRDPDDDLERVVASLMMWSDATHLASFGDASLWPVYLLFGNQSKYTRGKPTASACHHVAYIPTLPDNFQDIYISIFGEASSNDTYTHCKRELMQAIWALLLDEKFMHAYKYGVVIRCGDGITRRVFPRFFSYSADYPEK